MATIRNQILDAIVSGLSGAGKPSGLTVNRFPVSDIEETSLPHSSVRPGRETVELTPGKTKAFPVRERRLIVKIEHRQKCSGTQSPDEALDPLIAWSTASILTNSALAALVLEVEESETEWNGDESDYRFGLATVSFVIRYKTNSRNQEATS